MPTVQPRSRRGPPQNFPSRPPGPVFATSPQHLIGFDAQIIGMAQQVPEPGSSD